MSGEVALVTGGGRGIGRAICLELAARGMDVAVNYAGSAAAAQEVVVACETFGVRALAVRADVSKEDDVSVLVESVVQHMGHIDVLVNNAGIARDELIVKMTGEEFDAVIATNLRGAFLCMKQASALMIRQRHGRMINISSVVGLRGSAGQVNYAASKAGVIGMTKSLAKELGRRGITVNAVAPGFIQTDMTAKLPEKVLAGMKANIPLARSGTPEDVARAVAFLAGDDAAYITGQVLRVDGGMAM